MCVAAATRAAPWITLPRHSAFTRKAPLIQGVSLSKQSETPLFTSVLIVLFLVWIHVGHLLHLFFPAGGFISNKTDLVFFFGIGSAVGAVFAVITFCISTFSLPMIMDRHTDLVTGIVTSINAVLRNRKVMLLWATTIVGGMLFSVVTGLLGLVVIFPIIGPATWHAYRETVDASAWPPRT